MNDVDDSALYPREGKLTHWVIYDHPREHPDYFVVRPWDIEKTGPVMRVGENGQPVCGLFRDLEKARAYCEQFGLAQIARSPEDDPRVVETWL